MPAPTWKDTIELELMDIWCEYVDWINLAHDGIQWRDIASIYTNL
jgi:hypothetical protein